MDGDINIQLYLAEPGADFDQRVAESRSRSQVEDKSVFWVVPLDDRIDRATVEFFRSEEMLSRKERGAQTKAELSLVSEEKRRLTNTLRPELRRLLQAACLKGTVYFRGNDRSPGDDANDVVRTASQLLGEVLPRVFDKFHLAAARVQKKDLDALTTSENLHGLTPVFAALTLLRDEKGKPMFELSTGPLAEILSRIASHHSYGKAPTGKTLADEFGGEPYGWSFEGVQLFTLCLLRAGKITIKSKGHIIESALSVEAKTVFGNNNLFRAASFEPKQGEVTFEDLVKAADAFQQTFGKQIAELEQGLVSRAIRDELAVCQDVVRDQESVLRTNRLPGGEVLTAAVDQMRAIRGGSEEQAIVGFNGSHAEIKEAIKRAQQLEQTLTPPALHTLEKARLVLDHQWSFLKDEPDTPAGLAQQASRARGPAAA